MQGQSNFGYGALYKVMQTKRYLFLFQMKNRVFVVDNTTMTGGTVEDIRSVLQPVLGKKYVVCKY